MNTREHFLSQQHQHILLEFLAHKRQYLVHDRDDKSIVSSSTTITTDREVDETSHINFQELVETIDILMGGVNTLNDDTQRLTSESLQYQNSLQSSAEDVSKLKITIEETHTSINAHMINQQLMEERFT
ncbi:unnamed protein product, partial [Rotaria sp. Silwood1]